MKLIKYIVLINRNIFLYINNLILHNTMYNITCYIFLITIIQTYLLKYKYFQYIYVFCIIKVYILIYNLNILSFFVLLNVVDNIDRKLYIYNIYIGLYKLKKYIKYNMFCFIFLIKYLNLLCYI
ncbi:LOW QUALITY PROTEIN: hypothetical protein PFUGPA_00823 [Plasmodium falciparum Palo Alto/Uganda]|uniref:Uncharacterized protein n=1 Tax=Plasmodium falciparum (isolate Palo Alto / Uganda) TaxID=57270 RepID=W4J624_PLAFP|nr:LOW QUALITY PROTEIN: hypothetical protein PFUGPA_00823 [Plasmodium falciparum Palo Alto/Uganda]